jgi:hypothetical protein
MALGSTQPLTEMSTRNLPGVKGGQRMGLTTSLSYVTCYRDSFTFTLFDVSHTALETKCVLCCYKLRSIGLIFIKFKIVSPC